MEAWTTGSNPGLLSLTGSSLPGILNYSDPLLAKILGSKKALKFALETAANSVETEALGKDDKKLFIEFLLAASEGDLVTLESLLRNNPQLVNKLYPTDDHGVSALVYAICFNNQSVIDSLLSNYNADPDLFDTLTNYTPLMWAVHFDQLDTIKLLLNHQADPELSPKDDGKNAISLINPEKTEIYEYFKSHNLLGKSSGITEEDTFYKSTAFEQEDPIVDDLATKIKLQSITASSAIGEEEESESVYEEDDEALLAQDPAIRTLPDFEYDKLLPEQYIKFTDSDIPSLLDYIFSLRTKRIQFQHDTRVPAAIVFQLLRYSHIKVQSEELSNFLFDCFTARLRAVTNTKSGVFNMATQEANGGSSAQAGGGDIVLLSYWLSVLQFLHYYLGKSETYTSYPRFLQEIINVVQSLVATLSLSINSRLSLLVDECLLDFTSLVDVSNVLYAKNWNFFKNKKKHPNTYEDIFNMLYPPSQNELMKPSPIRYLQVLGALDYVLKIHKVDNLIRSQTFSQVFYYSNCIIFNRIIGQSRYCGRTKAIQIRLNISAIEDWLRSHNYRISVPESIGGLNKLVGDGDAQLQNLLKEEKLELANKDPHFLRFYYNSLYHVGKSQLQPTIELLQWLQCMSLLTDEESLINTINQFDSLNYYQLFKVMNKLYRYEVEETKLPKKLTQLVKNLMNEQGETQIARMNQHYMTQSNFLTKEIYIYLNPNFIFGVGLPNLTEMISKYGSGLGGIRVLRNKKYQPSLPISIVDDVDDILTENKNNAFNDSFDYDQQREDDDAGAEDEELPETNEKALDIKGDELFKQVQMPNSLAHKPWGEDEFESNPW
ncbi:uncharacterized protein CANTADRAFT_47018 [Suhomyces tanzawaensis NRRL Y-17324]|uniref:Dilute domain-containing protein n=1 Tax=Suhomyces tanzawaensis NRRL Y-17324 TaxID=984487 RepID=A0A1E4SN16_9ASCO|nr:uncharacterized protein CANTADRAFT_47018 [Suhomyces tanzawaensis NRRL Y-17324]ODV80919.1 hypothetical protein CANTADRAFT_47018 [Suhomyces tanzawaensis NRRL Y-17324]